MIHVTTHSSRSAGLSDALMEALGNVLVGLVLLAARLVKFLFLFPMLSAPLVASIAAGYCLGVWAGAGAALASVAGLLAWWLLHRGSFHAAITDRIRRRWLTWTRYRRPWARVLTACNLAARDGQRVIVPRLVSVTLGASVDTVRVRILSGQSPADWAAKVVHLAHGFGCTQASATIAGPSLIDLRFRRSDALADPVAVDVDSIAGFRKVTTAADLDAA